MNLERYYGLVIDRAGLPSVPEVPARWAEQLDVPILPLRQDWVRAYGSSGVLCFARKIPTHITGNPKQPLQLATPWGTLTRPARKPAISWIDGDWHDFPELVLMHELGHAANDDWNPRHRKTTKEAEIGAWEWAVTHLERPLTDSEACRMLEALFSYGICPACATAGEVQDLTALLDCK